MAELMFGNASIVQRWQRDNPWNVCVKAKYIKLKGVREDM
jgi:hypothetical protein